VIKYIGSKRVLVPLLVETISRIHGSGTVLDLFSGTSRVGHALKRHGYRVVANDHNNYARVLGTCYVQADADDHLRSVERLVQEFNRLPGRPGYFTSTFCEQSRFFHPKNGARVDAIREAIALKGLPPELEAVMLVSLMEAADRVDSTTGVQMAYLKQWAARAHNDLELRVPELLPRAASGKGETHGLDALQAVRTLEADIAYLDPPYNQHKYLGNYHVWESLVLWDKPEVYGIACKRIDCKERGSAFNSKREAGGALGAVLREVQAPHLVVSFNNEGYFAREEIEAMLAHREHVMVISQDFKRYVGAQIGIHNLKGEKVGKVSHLRNTEYIYVATDDGDVARRIAAFCDTIELPNEPAASGALPSSRAPASPSPPARPAQDDAGLSAALLSFLEQRGEASSSEAQQQLGVDAATLRPLFRDLIDSGKVVTTGQRRGTRYHWVPADPPEDTVGGQRSSESSGSHTPGPRTGQEDAMPPARRRATGTPAQQELFSGF
jgi:adenine-specific DNA-methyltransferase